jgi:hypothetical protein
VKPTKKKSASVARLEGLSRRLIFKLHIKRTKLLESDRDKIQTTMKKRNNLNINLLDRPSSLATLADFFLGRFHLDCIVH